MILTPKKDTVTLCLPTEWVGKPIVCILKAPYETDKSEVVSYVSEAAMCYRSSRFRNPKVRCRVRRRKIGFSARRRKSFNAARHR